MTTENIALQAWRKDISYILHAVQGESDSRTFNFILYDQTGAVISLTGKTVAFYVQKPDGNIVMLATTTSGSTISVTLTLQACAVPGVMPCWIQLVDENGDDLRVDSLLLEVQACDFDGAVESSSEFTALQEALGDVAKFSGHLTDYSNPHQVTAEQANAVPTERTVNGKPLSADIALNATDVGAMGSETVVPVSQGGTGQSTPAAARNALGLGDMAEVHFGDIYQNSHKVVDYDTLPMNNLLQARSNLGVGISLWSGNWSSGSITAEGLDAYSVYKIAFSEVGTCAIVSKNGNSIRGLGGNAATATTYRQQYFSANTDGNGTWEKVYFCEFNPVSGAQTQTLTVVQIIGIC